MPTWIWIGSIWWKMEDRLFLFCRVFVNGQVSFIKKMVKMKWCSVRNVITIDKGKNPELLIYKKRWQQQKIEKSWHINGRLFFAEVIYMSNRKEEILIVALHLFARDGYEAVSVSQIEGTDTVVSWWSYRRVRNTGRLSGWWTGSGKFW